MDAETLWGFAPFGLLILGILALWWMDHRSGYKTLNRDE